MVNDGIKDGFIINDPFRGFDFPKANDSQVKALESHQLNELYDIKCRSNSKYLNIWFACFYLQGARIGDVLRMKYGDIDNDKIVYNMKKTKNVRVKGIRYCRKKLSARETTLGLIC